MFVDLRCGVVYERVAMLRSSILLVTTLAAACARPTDALVPDAWHPDGEPMDKPDGNPSDAPPDAPPITISSVALAGGWAHTCGISTIKGLSCWGQNPYGELGTGNREEVHMPVQVSGPMDVVAVAARNNHSCALVGSGAAFCWGRNSFGRLGDGTDEDRLVPTPITLPPTTSLAAGTYHTCAITSTGGVQCWGRNDSAQLGDDSQMDRHAPTPVPSIKSEAVAVTLGTAHTCALLSTGSVRCWGANDRGQLGDGTEMGRRDPVDVSGLTATAIAIAAGDEHTCALLSTGNVQCWGDNRSRQLGTDRLAFSATPLTIADLDNATALVAGGEHNCVIVAGGVKCWGYNNAGQLGSGDSSSNYSAIPVDVVGLSGVAAIGSGSAHTCAALVAGGAVCWGSNVRGALGDGTTNTSDTPVGVVGF
jgi:alpha-tubulin suppressor-like RCC1 family protein